MDRKKLVYNYIKKYTKLMETKINENLYKYKLNGDDYTCGKNYGMLLLKRHFDVNLINEINLLQWVELEKNNNKLTFKILKNKIKNWIYLLKSEYNNLIKFESGLADSFNVNVERIIELEIICEISGIFCTIYTNKNLFYRILDTNKFQKKLLAEKYNEIHILDVNGKIIFCNPVFQIYHTLISEKFNFAIFGNNQLDKDLYLKNDIPFYFKLKNIYDKNENINDFINNLKNETIYYDCEIIIQDKNNSYNYDCINKKIIKSISIERSDYSPINIQNIEELHLTLPDFNRIFIIFIKDNHIYFNNSLVDNNLIKLDEYII
jgi:hypothetical protein